MVFVKFGDTGGPDDSNSPIPCEPRHWCTGNRTAAVETRKFLSELAFLIWHLGGICLWLQGEVQRSRHKDRHLVNLQWSTGSWHEGWHLQSLPEHLLNEKDYLNVLGFSTPCCTSFKWFAKLQIFLYKQLKYFCKLIMINCLSEILTKAFLITDFFSVCNFPSGNSIWFLQACTWIWKLSCLKTRFQIEAVFAWSPILNKLREGWN